MIKFDSFFVLFHCIILNPMLAIAVRSTVPFFPTFTPIAAMQFDSFIELIYILIECLVLVRCHKRQKITHKLTASYTWRTNKNVLSCHHKETVTAYRNGEKSHRFESMKKKREEIHDHQSISSTLFEKYRIAYPLPLTLSLCGVWWIMLKSY